MGVFDDSSEELFDDFEYIFQLPYLHPFSLLRATLIDFLAK